MAARSLRLLLLALSLFLVKGAAADDALYLALGGNDGVTRIVETTIDLAVADPRIGKVFDNTNIPRLKGLLFQQICELSGGPCAYRGQGLKPAHKGLDINHAHFNAMVEDLQTAMDREHISYANQNRLLAILAPMRRDVVTK